jgi:predicted GH43/DUF377 family glycosyl hydrolase
VAEIRSPNGSAVTSRPTIFRRQATVLRPDPSRVLVRPFRPSVEPRDLNPLEKTRANHIVDRVLALDPETAASLLSDVLLHFEGRHRNLIKIFEQRADEMECAFSDHPEFSRIQRQLVGAYFVHEYSFEASALFNPSIVPHPDQGGVAAGSCRFVLSLRSVGEGHISSLTFRSGLIDAAGHVSVSPAARLATMGRIVSREETPTGEICTIRFSVEEDLSERVVFPMTLTQQHGIEDARFVSFADSGELRYIATFTAYSGVSIRSELIETSDFLTFTLSPMQGTATFNKGMALFPRKLGGRYAMIGRQDNENLFLIYSDDLYNWAGGIPILRPLYPWEFVQIGTCGSPIELDEGWLLLTHGVGPVRRYAIGAVLLDKDDPSKVLRRSREPLVHPEPSEREGYVPNVVYTCGAMRHLDRIILPYAVSDTHTRFASISIAALLAGLDPV